MPVFFSGISFWSLILLVLGIGFLVAEIFHPGFGLPGVLGLIALGLDILISARTFAQGLLMTAIAAVIVLAIFLIGATLFDHGRMPKMLVLQDENGSQEGFVSGVSGVQPGQSGRAVTVLRPAGIAQFGSVRADVVTQGEFIPKGEELRVLSAEGGRVVVCAADKAGE